MKYCKNCGAENNDENLFCFNCRCDSFNDAAPAPSPVQPAPTVPPVSPVPPVQPAQRPPVPPMPVPPMVPPMIKQKKPLGIFDLFCILGFVASIVGMFSVSIILHPLAAISSILGFIGNTRFKALAIAGFVIAIVGGVVFTVISLYQNGYIPEWITDGAFHSNL